MTELFSTPMSYDHFHMSQAVRIGSRVEISGQGGIDDAGNAPDSLAEEIAVAFTNVEARLASAGAGWEHVYSIVSYHVPTPEDGDGLLHHVPIMVANMRKQMPDRRPIWTCVGVETLGEPQMRVEIRAFAHLGD